MGMSNQAPPLGLRPVWVAASLRIQEILEAMLRYQDAGWPVPQLWLDELKFQNQRQSADALEQCHRELARTANAIDDIYRASAEGRDLICVCPSPCIEQSSRFYSLLLSSKVSRSLYSGNSATNCGCQWP